MTSQRQVRQDNYDHILPFIQEAADEYYGGNLDKGFRHWAFATIFAVGHHDVQGNDIVDYTAIDGSDDFEIDGFFIPDSDDDSVVHLFQSKRRQPGTTMGPAEIAKFLHAPNRILNGSEVAASHNEETKALHDRLMEMLHINPTACSINLVWATSGVLSPAARRTSEANSSRTMTVKCDGNPVEVTVSLECWDLDRLHEEHQKQQESDDVIAKCDYEFQLAPGTYHQTGGDAEYRTLYMTVPVKQVIDVFARHNYKIFRLNPRGPLGNKINSSIKNTLLDPIGRNRFHLLNNGLTAICDSWQLVGDSLSVKDFQVVNGCQTTVTLWDARAAVSNEPNVQVTIKLTECPSHFSPIIASTTNKQAALKPEDFTSNESVQIRLHQEFSGMTPPWFYEIKRGQWSKMSGGPQDKERFRVQDGGYHKFTSREVAQAVVAFAGFPGEAKDKIRDFLNKENVPSLAREDEFSYDKIYTPNVSAARLLLPAVVQRKVWQKVSVDKANMEWLEYARFHIVWLVGDLLREHYEMGNTYLFSVTMSTTLAAHVDEWFDPIYTLAVASIHNAVEQSEGSGQYREFFRSPKNYRTMESNLQGARLLAANFGDPMANLPV